MPGCHYAFEAIGTVWKIEIFDEITATDSEELLDAITVRIERYDKTYSRFRHDSLVSDMALKQGRYLLPEDAEPLLNLYKQLYDITGGAITPLIGQTLADAGYDASYSLKPHRVDTPPKWESVLAYAFPNLSLSRPALLDFGAAGKGYLVDMIGVLLEERSVKSYCINAGGDILYHTASGRALEIALEHPGDSTMAIGIARISNQSLCGSSGNRRVWGKFHHILDPHSLTSPTHTTAVWVAAETGLIADGLSTALFFTEPHTLMKYYDFEYAIVRKDYSLQSSPGFPAEFFTGTDKHTREKLR